MPSSHHRQRRSDRSLVLFAIAFFALATPLRAAWFPGPWWLPWAAWGVCIAAIALVGRRA